MAVLTDVTVPAEDFVLQGLLHEYPAAEVAIEPSVPLGGDVLPLVWVAGVPPDDAEAAIRNDPLAEDVAVVTETGDRRLFDVRWRPDVDGLVRLLVETDATLLRAHGHDGEWELRLRFRSRERLASFRERCADAGIDLVIRGLYNPTLPAEDDDGLTPAQRELIAATLDHGYWEIPRGHTLGEVAEEVGISTNAASQRLRRGIRSLVEDAIVRER